MNTIQDGITFGAKLDYSKLNGDKARLSRIAKIFEKKTSKYPNDVFKVETNDKGGIYFHPQYANKDLCGLNSYDKGEISKRTTNFLNKYSDETIANVLKKLLFIRRKADSMLADYFKLENKHGLTDKIYTEDDTILGEFFNSAMKVREDMTKIMLKRDGLLKKLKGISIT